MKKLLIIALLFVGCEEYAPTEHTHDAEHTHDTVKLVSYLYYYLPANVSYENCYQAYASIGAKKCYDKIQDKSNPMWEGYKIHNVHSIMHLIETNEFIITPEIVPDTIKADTLGYASYDRYLEVCAFPQGYIFIDSSALVIEYEY